MVAELLTKDGRVVGAVGIPMDSDGLVVFRAKAVVLAAGAGGFRPTRWPINNLTSDADCMAYRVGAEITGKEFADPHSGRADQAAFSSFGRFGRSPEGGRPARGMPVDAEGNRPPAARGLYLNLDFVAHQGRAPIYFELEDGGRYPVVGGAATGHVRSQGGRHLARRHRLLLQCARALCRRRQSGDDAVRAPPTLPSANRSWAARSPVRMPGPARRATRGRRAPLEASDGEIEQVAETLTAPLRRSGGFGPRWVTQMLQNTMIPYYVMYVKHGDRLQAALTNVEFFRDHLVPLLYAGDQHELRLVHETRNMVLNAEMRLRASLFRTETRGCHYREDYPLRDDQEWLAWVAPEEGCRRRDGRLQAAHPGRMATGSLAALRRALPEPGAGRERGRPPAVAREGDRP